jgi:hypothetical protein
VHIDREEVLKVDRVRLPADAEYKGCEAVVVQDLQLHPNNVHFYYYSARLRMENTKIWSIVVTIRHFGYDFHAFRRLSV